jgi:hypothetical protein
MRLSNRDILLVLGIVVALIISLTAFVYKDKIEMARREFLNPAPKKTSMIVAAAHKLISIIDKRSSVEQSQ